MKIAYLGAGTWGFCLSLLLSENGHDVTLWAKDPELVKTLLKKREHPKLPGFKNEKIRITSDLSQTLKNAELIVESVTSSGVRPVFEEVVSLGKVSCPVIITSKGIEQDTGLLLPEVVAQVLGKNHRSQIGCLSGPSHAEEVIRKLPTAIVCSAYDKELMKKILEIFSTPYFRIYPNSDINGVAFGGAMKNIVAIACGIALGLGFGDNTVAALMTRGLHEMRKLSAAKECNPETLNGLSGLGDLCVTCMSKHSRNNKFGKLIGEGVDAKKAQEKIGMVVEGIYTCVSAFQLGKKHHIPIPITEAVYSILYEGLNPRDAVKTLLQRAIKEEHL
ncbi:MAG: NAD(P)-dependent glycerol-3-phosphate dehydrogenase [Chlamydiae bacterium]|nr:NAD(P)-dependent glycerol-3-phosphate dehydrogenase [Chlamydiota bacterium]